MDAFSFSSIGSSRRLVPPPEPEGQGGVLTPPAGTVKIWPVGDSLTWGYNSTDFNASYAGYRWPLWNLLVADGFTINFLGINNGSDGTNVALPDKDHDGHSGNVISSISGNIATDRIVSYAPDIVLLLAGTNDMIQAVDLPNAPTRLTTLAQRFLDNSSAHVLIGTIPMLTDYQARVDDFNAALPAAVAAMASSRVTLLDVGAAITFMPNPDKIHPARTQYNDIAAVWHEDGIRPLYTS